MVDNWLAIELVEQLDACQKILLVELKVEEKALTRAEQMEQRMVDDLDANKVVLTVIEKVELWVDHSVALLVDELEKKVVALKDCSKADSSAQKMALQMVEEMVDLLVVLLVAVWDVMRVEEKLNWMVVMENVQRGYEMVDNLAVKLAVELVDMMAQQMNDRLVVIGCSKSRIDDSDDGDVERLKDG